MAVAGFVPRHSGQHEGQAAEAGDPGEQQAAARHEREQREPRIDRERQPGADGGHEAHDDLHLAHERQYFAFAPVHRQAGVNPGLGAAFDEHAARKTRALESLDGPAGASARLANDERTPMTNDQCPGGGVDATSPLVEKCARKPVEVPVVWLRANSSFRLRHAFVIRNSSFESGSICD